MMLLKEKSWNGTQNACIQLKAALMSVSALRLPNLEKSFELCMQESSHIALGALIQQTASCSELALKAARGGRKVSRTDLQLQHRISFYRSLARQAWQGYPGDPLPGLAWPQPSSTWLSASY